ncbi:ATP-binding protein [Streptomyces liangshanensis]|uniref:ATP-binding protein n=1 Tax=Streptomyces liangshanensis TaxID=2717324 RepID=A0A6G9GXD2_9ACTN|nr:ATP-binding protein [Streptomyces liangshanensis]QIQ02874.1 ATP-binding protein [Streptomyces liangshanensis]
MVGLIDTQGARSEWTFPAEPGAVRTARHSVRDTLRAWEMVPAVCEAAVLLVSELVTNSLRYTPGPIGVKLAIVDLAPAPDPSTCPQGDTAPATGRALLVEVSDPLPDPPTPRTSALDDEGGRGLRLVACSSRRWGTRRGKTGKTVWFELPLPG